MKPVCVDLSQAARRLMGTNGKPLDVLHALERLLKALKNNDIRSTLDAKLAEYVFFPIGNVLRQLERLPLRAQELTLQCISILLEYGWRADIKPDLGIQLIILLSFLIDPPDTKLGSVDDKEDLRAAGLESIGLVFKAVGSSEGGCNALSSITNVPHIGKVVSVILAIAVQSKVESLRNIALKTLQEFCNAWPDLDALSTRLFPGIISSLTKLLTPKSNSRTSAKGLALSLRILSDLIGQVLPDTRTKGLPEASAESPRSSELSQTWLKATGGQLKLALSSVLKLRRHDRAAVRSALASLCIKCLKDCWLGLAESRMMFLETLIIISATEPDIKTEMKHLMAYHDTIPELLRKNLYNGIQALPRVALSPDDLVQRRSLTQVSVMLQLLTEQGEQLVLAQDLLASNIRDTVINTIKAVSKKKIGVVDGSLTTDVQSLTLHSHASKEFDNVLSRTKGQASFFGDLSQFISSISSSSTSLSIARYLAAHLRYGGSDEQIANLWLFNQLSKKLSMQSNWASSFTNDVSDTATLDDLMDQAYNFALDVLVNTDESTGDWRLHSLALETIAFQAQNMQEDFRPELIDCLYPVVQSLASSNEFVQNYAITCLNVVSEACGFHDIGALVVENVDYLVNSVGIHLNILSPQAPVVLIMMVKLAGPKLLPFLDDLVDSIFAALESFHGYPKLVDLSFLALSSIVEQGVHSPQLTIASTNQFGGGKTPTVSSSINDLAALLRTRRMKETQQHEKSLNENLQHVTFPKSPWKTAEDGMDRLDDEQLPKTEEEEDDEVDLSDEKDNVGEHALTKPHQLLLNITKLTQHYLTTDSLMLRIRLLNLLKTSIPVLAADENSFLPLINTIWPVTISRLQDDETFVVAGALDVIALMCTHAGSFMTSRITESWNELRTVHARCFKSCSRAQPKPALDLSKEGPRNTIRMTGQEWGKSKTSAVSTVPRYSQGPVGAIWSSLLGLLKVIATNVRVIEPLFDEMMDMVLPILVARKDVQEALNIRNPDAVWLALWRLNNQRE